MSDTGVSIVVDLPGLDAVQSRLERLANRDLDELLEAIGSEVSSQSQRRIQKERTGPDGKEWAGWSESYKRRRKKGKTLLRSQGHLMGSLQHLVTPEGVEVGSNLIYARIHQLGGEPVGIPIPARPYLGLSKENEDDVLSLVNAFFEDALE